MKQLLKSNQLNDKEKLNKLCVQNAENFYLNDSTWLYIDDIKKKYLNLKHKQILRLVPVKLLNLLMLTIIFILK